MLRVIQFDYLKHKLKNERQMGQSQFATSIYQEWFGIMISR